MGEILIGGTASLLICIFLSPSFIAPCAPASSASRSARRGPAGHHAKAGTPTMGGIIIFTAISVPFLILVDYSDWRAVGVYIAAIACAGLGSSTTPRRSSSAGRSGLRGRWKLVITILISLFLWWVATEQAGLSSTLRLRSIDATIDLGIFYPVLIYLVVAGTSNAVNLTDGLDGLARAARRSCCSPTSASRSSRRASRSSRCSAAAWSAPASGFLWFNAFPATIFMGDTGSLGLGGAIAGWRS
jgi:phospho-N-acetylmuramoyl-pentapeptide-transferase